MAIRKEDFEKILTPEIIRELAGQLWDVFQEYQDREDESSEEEAWKTAIEEVIDGTLMWQDEMGYSVGSKLHRPIGDPHVTYYVQSYKLMVELLREDPPNYTGGFISYTAESIGHPAKSVALVPEWHLAQYYEDKEESCPECGADNPSQHKDCDRVGTGLRSHDPYDRS